MSLTLLWPLLSVSIDLHVERYPRSPGLTPGETRPRRSGQSSDNEHDRDDNRDRHHRVDQRPKRLGLAAQGVEHGA